MRTREQIQTTKELLDIWASLEPDRCIPLDHLSFNVLQDGHLNIVWLMDRITVFSGNVLQGAVQEAIASRKLLFCLENVHEGDFYAKVRKGARDGWYGKADVAAIALLIAYVDFLKSEVAQNG